MRYQLTTKMHSSNIVLAFFLCLFSATKKDSAVLGNSLVLLNKNSDCVCSGQTLMFECKVTGVGSTVWRGSAFDCPLREIVLRHSQFVDSTGTCSDGAIVARGVSVESNCYNSRLSVTLSSHLNGESIVCTHHNSTGTTDIGTFVLNIASEPHPPPDNVHLNSVNSRSLTFSWNPVNTSCHTLGYSLASPNCGVCPANTTNTSMTCHNVPVDGSVCLFQVQTAVCNNNHGPLGTSVTVTLKVPVVSLVKTVPCFLEKNRNLTEIQTTFNETDRFMFADKIDGSVTSYTLNYTDTISGTSCGLATIPASSCRGGVCHHVFEASLSSCPFSDGITVTVIGTNLLGNGTSSPPVSTSTTNNFVRVIIDLLSAAVVCQFIEDRDSNNAKSCSITYGPFETCNNLSGNYNPISNTTVASNSVVIKLPILSESTGMEYCYIATASNGTFTAMVKGTFSTVCNPIVLGDVSLLPMDVTCDPPFNSLGIENGVVCYSGTEIGSVAFYLCIHCGLNFDAIKNGSSVRVCGEDGHWNGSSPQCSCQQQSRGNSNHLGLVIALSMVLVLFVILTPFSVGCSAATCILAKDRVKLKRQLEVKMIVYEEIDIKGQSLPNVDTTENIAYATASETVLTV